MITVLTRIRSVPERYRARMREIVRAYTLVNERDEDWVDDFYAHRLAAAAAPHRAASVHAAVRPAPRRRCTVATRSSPHTADDGHGPLRRRLVGFAPQ